MKHFKGVEKYENLARKVLRKQRKSSSTRLHFQIERINIWLAVIVVVLPVKIDFKLIRFAWRKCNKKISYHCVCVCIAVMEKENLHSASPLHFK